MDYCKYVNVFQGNGEIDLPKPEGLAAKWFFIKAQCGNTTPAAVSPFGAMSVCAYTGGYPTGYGNHLVNTHAAVGKFPEGNFCRGFTHLHQSGTGTIRYYYNFLLTTPRYDETKEYYTFSDEKAEPGYYSCVLGDEKKVFCEVTALGKAGCHRYSFDEEGGYATVDFSHQGLNMPGHTNETQDPVEVVSLEKTESGTVVAEIKTEGVSLFFALSSDGDISLEGDKATIKCSEKTLNIKVAVSCADCETVIKTLEEADSFDEMKIKSHDEWNEKLGAFHIETTDEEVLEIFYSNLYHSLVKPCDFDGESFVYDKNKPFMTDFATLWDMYKTQLPLIFMSYRDIGQKIVETILSLGEALEVLPNSFGINSKYLEHTSQARMLGDYALLTAYRYGYDIDVKRLLKVIVTDVFADNKTDFTKDGRCASHTWLLDMADGCALAMQLAEETGDKETAELLKPLAEKWRTVYDENTGLLGTDSSYYEGTLYNYSFRQMVEMDERIAIAGGKEKFVKLLDDFFGYGKPDTTQPTDPTDSEFMKKGMALGRFEGFNNESDTETPFTYILADRYDRTCEVISAGLKYMFTTGRGGLPGNNDTGALSSYYCITALGLFPVSGQDLFLFGSPIVDKAEIKLANGRTLSIKVFNRTDKNVYVEKITFNDKEITDARISASALLQGGELCFYKSATA